MACAEAPEDAAEYGSAEQALIGDAAGDGASDGDAATDADATPFDLALGAYAGVPRVASISHPVSAGTPFRRPDPDTCHVGDDAPIVETPPDPWRPWRDPARANDLVMNHVAAELAAAEQTRRAARSTALTSGPRGDRQRVYEETPSLGTESARPNVWQSPSPKQAQRRAARQGNRAADPGKVARQRAYVAWMSANPSATHAARAQAKRQILAGQGVTP